jgi:hypothetical protein
MNMREKYFYNLLLESGYEVQRNGWPDFLCRRIHRDREYICAVEVKHRLDRLSPSQVAMHRLLESVGIPVNVLCASAAPVALKTVNSLGRNDVGNEILLSISQHLWKGDAP